MTNEMSARALAPFILIASLVLVQIWQDGSPPLVVGREAPADQFSALRALDHLAQFAVTPHPLGSPANHRVADYIESRVKSVGLELDRRPGLVLQDGPFPVVAAVENLLVRVPGTNSTRAILLTAHYDSVPGAPGASDDGAGVATLLESLSVLRSSPPLRNDVLFLFTDGEELGLLGAREFARNAPEMAEIGVVLNFEGRGNRGPVWLFETSVPNEWIVRQFAQASPFPVGNSLSYEIYKRLPNDTDFSVFRRQGLPGFNFAHFGGITQYHTRLDNLSNLDQTSLQHHGSYAVALTRWLGAADLSHIDPGEEVIYGNPIANAITYYPRSWVVPSLVSAWLLLAATLLLGARRKGLNWRGFLAGLLAQLVLMLLCPLLIWGLWRLIWRFHPQRDGLIYGQPYAAHWWMMGLAALGCVGFLLGMRPWLKRWPALGVIAGIVTATLILATPVCWLVPGSHFLLFWPALGAVLALLIRSLEGEEPSWGGSLALAAVAFPATILPAQAGALHEALTLNGVLAPVLVMIFFLGTLSPQFAGHFTDIRLPRLGLICALGLFLLGVLNGTFTAARPRADSLAYAIQEGAEEGYWVSSDSSPDRFTELFLQSPQVRSFEWLSPLHNRPLLASAAPRTSISGIGVEVDMGEVAKGSSSQMTRRSVKLLVRPGAEGSFLALESAPGTRILAASVEGLPLSPPALAEVPWTLRYLAPPAEGIRFEFELEAQGEAAFNLVESRRGWPQALQRTRRRPPETQSFPYPYWLQDSTLVARQVRIDLGQ